MAHHRARPTRLPFSPDETAYCGCAWAARRSPTCWDAADVEDEVGDGTGGDKAATIGCSECEDQLAGKRAQRYCSVPPRPNPLPCQPCIPGTRNLQIDQNSLRTDLIVEIAACAPPLLQFHNARDIISRLLDTR